MDNQEKSILSVCYKCVNVAKGYKCKADGMRGCLEVRWDLVCDSGDTNCPKFIQAPVNYWKRGHPCGPMKLEGGGS
jgi:hypothetical protein